MSPAQRLDSVHCPICMDSLFNKHDDLDEICPIATPDCGHVFHEECLLDWFKAQTSSWIAAQRERQDPHEREDSPTGSEAPVECPTCRAECFVDPETGQMNIHRLFINLSGDGSSQAGSSPIRPTTGGSSSKGKDREVMGLARRAKGLTAEVKGMNADSAEEDMEGGMRRMKQLEEDLVSVKAVEGIKTYVGGLSKAISDLKKTLETHPVIDTLRGQVAEHQQKVKRAERDMREMATITMPQEVQKAVDKERKKAAAQMNSLEKDVSSLRRGLQEEQVARRHAKSAAEEREKDHSTMMAMMKREMETLKADKASLTTTLNERTKTLKLLSAKVEGRRELKAEIEELKKENKALRAQIEMPMRQQVSPPASAASPEKQLQDEEEDDKLWSDLPDIDLDDTDQPVLRGTGRPRQSTIYDAEDESLIIDSSSFIHPSSSPSRVETVRHPTARTFSFDIGAKLFASGSKGNKTKTNAAKHSKYFDNKENPASFGLIADDEDEDVMVLDSSPPPLPTASQLKRKANPFQTTKEESEKRKALKMTPATAEVVDLTACTPERPVFADKKNIRVSTNTSALGKTSSGSMLEKLSIVDAQGRPKKGVVAGIKARRRA